MLSRREVIQLLAAAPLAHYAIRVDDVERAAAHAAEAVERLGQRAYEPRFFTPSEWRMVRTLSDLIIPRDERSGSATEAAVPEFLDFLMTAYTDMQRPMRDGLVWMDAESARRFNTTFLAASPAQRTELLDAIAYPKRATAAVKDGVTFFTRFRDLAASGFWSSRIGVADLEYLGNRALPAWTGCPPVALRKLGVSYGG
jgi:hypothetical protein